MTSERRLRASERHQRGQALPMAAVGLLIMCLSVIATLNLSQAVHQKIKLQNTADSAAYTLAAMEARTFNYIAFLNRAQIAHYNTAAVVQSYISWVGFHVGMFGTAVDVLETLKNAYLLGFSKGGCAPYSYSLIVGYCSNYAASYVPMQIALQTLKQTLRGAKQAYARGGQLGHTIVEAMSVFNAGLIWQMQFARAALLNTHLLTGMQSHISKLDPDIGFSSGKSMLINMLVNSALNSIEYYQTFDAASGLNPFAFSLIKGLPELSRRGFMVKKPGGVSSVASKARGGTDSSEAYKVMAELCNASRSPYFVSDRRAGDVQKRAGVVSIYGPKFGQTKFTKSGSMTGAMIRSIYTDRAFPVGKYLSSNDFALMAGGQGTAAPASIFYLSMPGALGDAIAAYNRNGRHYKYRGKGGRPAGQTIVFPPPENIPLLGGMFRSSSHAKWPGFAAYFKFKPKGDSTADYNQPSTWIMLHKHHKTFQTEQGSHASGRSPWFEKFTWTQGGKVVSLDSTIGGKRTTKGLLFWEGLLVISRGMAYYHRPGNWKEHPNFFNPFWRARLAPVGQKLQALWDRWVTGKITTSSNNAAVRALVNVLRNAQMDLVTGVITAAITH